MQCQPQGPLGRSQRASAADVTKSDTGAWHAPRAHHWPAGVVADAGAHVALLQRVALPGVVRLIDSAVLHGDPLVRRVLVHVAVPACARTGAATDVDLTASRLGDKVFVCPGMLQGFPLVRPSDTAACMDLNKATEPHAHWQTTCSSSDWRLRQGIRHSCMHGPQRGYGASRTLADCLQQQRLASASGHHEEHELGEAEPSHPRRRCHRCCSQ